MAEEFSLTALRDYMIKQGGRATNHELVKHFKKFLTDPSLKDEARAQFRDFVNTLASVKQEGDEKYLVLKKKYYPEQEPSLTSATSLTSVCSADFREGSTPPRYRPPPTVGPQDDEFAPLRNVPSSRNPICLPEDADLALDAKEEAAPFLPPRKKQVAKVASDPQNKENEQIVPPGDKPEEQKPRPASVVEETAISVKERTQKFNRLASQSGLHPVVIRGNNLARGSTRTRSKNMTSMMGGPGASPSVRRPIRLVIRAPRRSKGGDEDDTSSLATMDPRAREWLLATARGDYNPIAKLLQEEPRLAKRKDYITTGLHWAAKHGNMDLVKLLAGTYSVDVHARSGYTALHLAAQQGHNEVYELLVKAYQINAKRALHEEKESGFLRIGSINVRVKKTTEKFNYLLGGDRYSHHFSSEKKQKSWGSADSLQATIDRQLMPPPKSAKKKRSKEWPEAEKPVIQVVNSPVLAPIHSESEETDSDSAYGFGSDWAA